MGLFDLFKKKGTHQNVTVSMSVHEYTPEELSDQREQEVSEIRQLAKESIPSKNGLRPHEIAMLAAAPKYKKAENNFPRYWYYSYGIDDPQKMLNMLFDRGFIRQAKAMEHICKLTVPELKKILSEAGIKVSGKKADLVSAIQENISEESLGEKVPIRKYVLTELGEQEIKENEYVTYFGASSRYGITVWDMNKMIQGYPLNLFRDKIWASLNERLQNIATRLVNSGNLISYYSEYSSINYEMCSFLLEENNHIEDALSSWAHGFYYDFLVLSPMSFREAIDLERFLDSPKMKRIRKQEAGQSELVEDNSSPSFRDSLSIDFKIRDVCDIKNKLSLSDEDLFQRLVSLFQKCSPVNYSLIKNEDIPEINASVEDIAGVVVAETDGSKTVSDTVYKNIEAQIKRKNK